MADEVTTASPTEAPASAPAETAPAPAAETPAPAPAKSSNSTGLGFEEFLSGSEGSKNEPSPSEADEPEPAADPDPAGDASDDAAPAADDAPAKESAGRDWDADDNPWKGKAAELEKRVKDTRDFSTQVNQQLADLKKQNEILQKKVDGTYDPATDGMPSPDQVAEEVRIREVTQARAKASVEAAKRIYGADALHAAIFADDAPFRKIEQEEPAVAAAIMAADAPAIAAMELLEVRRFEARWGRTPTDIEKAIRADERALAEKDFNERLAKRTADRAEKRQSQPRGVADARGGNVPASSKGHVMPSLAELGNRGFA